MLHLTSRRLALALVLVVTLTACGGAASGSTEPAKTITLALNEFQFQPAEITVDVGQTVKLVLKNNGTVLHDFVSTDAKVEVLEEHGAEHDMGGMPTTMHAAIEAGQQSTLEFKATQAGTYTFYCTIAGHKEAGMTGKLTVK